MVLSKRDILGLTLGLVLGVLLLVVTSIVLDQNLFGVTWTPRQEYYLKIDLSYLYIRIENITNNTPLLGGKTLIWYVAIVRVENPYNNSIGISKVELHIPEQVYINCNSKSNVTVTVTVGKPVQQHSETTFDAWINKTICGYGFFNDLLRGSAERVFERGTYYWINGGDPRFNHMYFVITGVVEIPKPWKYRLERLGDYQYVVLEAQGYTVEGENIAEALKITSIKLTRIDSKTYVYNTLPLGVGFDLEGSVIQTFYNGFWP